MTGPAAHLSPGPQRASTAHDALVRLGDTDLTLVDPAQDLRQHTVTDLNGRDIGHVSALFIDREERRVRFLQVQAGGFLGLGARTFLVPVEDVTSLRPLTVQLGHPLDTVTSAPAYDPELTDWHDAAFWNAQYSHYGYPAMTWPGY